MNQSSYLLYGNSQPPFWSRTIMSYLHQLNTIDSDLVFNVTSDLVLKENTGQVVVVGEKPT